MRGSFGSWGLMGAGANHDGHFLSLRCERAWAPAKDPPPFFCQAAVITPLVHSLFQEAGQLLGKVRGEVGSLRAGGLVLPLCSLIWADGSSTALAPGDLAVAQAPLSLSRWPWVSPRGTTHLPHKNDQVQVVGALHGVAVRMAGARKQLEKGRAKSSGSHLWAHISTTCSERPVGARVSNSVDLGWGLGVRLSQKCLTHPSGPFSCFFSVVCGLSCSVVSNSL